MPAFARSTPRVFFPALLTQARHDFDVSSSLATRGRVGVETFGGKPIDVELPASVSGQHLVNFYLWLGKPKGDDGGELGASIQAELTVPVHLRYPDPGCDRQGEDCERYEWVEVSKRTPVTVLRVHVSVAC